MDKNELLEEIVKKYNYSYNYYEGYSYNREGLPGIYMNNKGFTIFIEGKHIEINSLEDFENIIRKEK